VRRLLALLLLAGAVVFRRRRAPEPDAPLERIVPPGPPDRRAEHLVLGLLALATLLALGFVLVYVLDRLPDQTQLLGLCLGLSLIALAAALIITGKRLIVTEELEHDYPPEEHPDEQQMVVQTVQESGSRITRRGLLKVGGAAAGGSLGLALLAPVASLGPAIDMAPFAATPWRPGRRLVDERGRGLRADTIAEGSVYTAFPEGADPEDVAAPVVVVRLSPQSLALPAAVAGFPAPGGILAFSKICTHAGCALTLYRSPMFTPNDPKPAFVCPCHYSTFDPATGGTVVFGPAGRKLPMLPLTVDASGYLHAAGTFDEPVGPSWWGVRERRATS
jgi:ubiquinol-cytochrome c reductase iron-sulfur subunit